MSIFRETFEPFVKDELKRRQAGMLTRNPSFLHQLNSRSAWVRMTSGVNVKDSKGFITNELAKKYVLQGGILNVNTTTQGDKVTDIFALKSGLGGASNSYSNLTVGGATNRLGIKPMPGITNVSIQSKGAYGSLQEATVSFVCWDIKQLEELELLYMRPGYTVLFEMGWDYARANGELPRYDILNKNTPNNKSLKQVNKFRSNPLGYDRFAYIGKINTERFKKIYYYKNSFSDATIYTKSEFNKLKEML